MTWAEKAGAAIGIATLLFLMAVVLLSFLKPLDAGTKWILILVFSLGCGLSASFIGGGAVARGKLRIPFLKSPVTFAVTGGIAVIVIMLILGKLLFLQEVKAQALVVPPPEPAIKVISHAYSIPNYRQLENTFSSLPKLEVVAEHRLPNLLRASAFLAKGPDIQRSQFLNLSPRAVSVSTGQLGQVRVSVDPSVEIPVRYKERPHGFYRAVVRVGTGEVAATERFDFNYIYSGIFTNLDSLLKVCAPKSAFQTTRQGLWIRHDYEKRGVVSAKLTQDFDFCYDFYVKGSFSVIASPRDPPGFDIGFCDGPGDKIAVIFGDGALDRYSIRQAEEANDQLDQFRSPATSATLRFGPSTANYFCIKVTKNTPEVARWDVYAGATPTEARTNLVHSRMLSTDLLGTGKTELRLKLWGKGTVFVRDLEVGQLVRL